MRPDLTEHNEAPRSEDARANSDSYPVLNFCGNQLINVQSILRVRGHVPIRIGRENIPFLSIDMPLADGRAWDPVVTNNVSRRSDVSIVVKEAPEQILELPSISVSFRDRILIYITANSYSEASVVNLDLRPLGLAVHGDRKGLWLASNFLSRNLFEEVDVAFDFS